MALLCMLFTQLTVAAYACPATVLPNVATMVMNDADQASMPGCTGMDIEQPSLCHAHAQVGMQSLDKPDLPLVQPFFAVGLPMIVLPINPGSPDTAVDVGVSLTRRTTAPPLAIRNCCFRI